MTLLKVALLALFGGAADSEAEGVADSATIDLAVSVLFCGAVC